MPLESNGFESVEQIFLDAANDFKSGLSDEGRKHFEAFASPEEMLRSVEDAVQRASGGRLQHACKLIANFSDSMEPFFEIVNIFVSSNPEFAAIAWGAIRLVFQLCSNYASFFERLAGMFQTLSQKLPNYDLQAELIRTRANNTSWRQSHQRLMKTLSQVYVNVLQLCYKATQLFTCKRPLTRWKKAGLVVSLAWTPLDERFRKTIEQLENHSRLFDLCVSSIMTEETLKHYDMIDAEIQASRQREERPEEAGVREKQAMDQKMLQIKLWLAASDWTIPYESALKIRTENTGRWFLENQSYLSWKSKDENPSFGVTPNLNQVPRLLILKGKPGYGKTVLSASIIEDLRKVVLLDDTTSRSDLLSGTVAYFYFEKRNAERRGHIAAIRAILMQLLQQHKHSKDIVDIMSLIMMDIGSGQAHAIEVDIVTALRLCMSKLKTSYVVVDGLDECEEWESFVTSITAMIENTYCKVAFITRPHLAISDVCGLDAYHLDLESLGNIKDIQRYLEPQVRLLVSRIAGNLSARDIVGALSIRANSMFLWARLMITYLRSPILTPRERLDAITGKNLLEGLDAMYAKILETIQRNLPRSHWLKVLRVFQMVAATIQPLRTTEIQTALAVRNESSATGDDIILQFKSALVQICGSLVEVALDDTVHFIHLSVSEYLEQLPSSRQYHFRVDDLSLFHLNMNMAHCYLASTCLRYLFYDIPHQPLGSAASTKPSKDVVAKRFPFLQYASEFWSCHVLQCLTGTKKERAKDAETQIAAMLDILEMVISNKSCITTWIEASWVFQSPPKSVVAPLSKVNLDTGTLIQKAQAIEPRLAGLSSCLAELSKHWQHILSEEPNEIWLPSINAFALNDSLLGTNSMVCRSLSSTEDDGSILIASQVSSCGTQIGIVRVWPSKQSELTERPRRWKVAYEIWSLETLCETFRTEIFVPESQIPSNYITHTHPTSNSSRPTFRFPIAISASLRLAVVLGRILEVHHDPATMPPYTCRMQLLNGFSPSQRSRWNRLHMECLYTPRRFLSDDLDNMEEIDKSSSTLEMTDEGFCTDSTVFHFQISPDERYLIVQESQVSTDHFSFPCVVSVYENSYQPKHSATSFQLRISVGVKICGRLKDAICVHPNQPLIAISLPEKVVIWDFSGKDSQLLMVCSYPICSIAFSKCGRYILGTRPVYGNAPAVIHIEHLLPQPAPQFPSNPKEIGDSASQDLTSQELQGPDVHPQMLLRHDASDVVQSTGSATLSIVDGRRQISVLKEESYNATVSLNTLREDGTLTQETLSRLPRSFLGVINSSIINTSDPGNVRVVLDKRPRTSYGLKARHEHDTALPVVIDRQTDSIPKTVYNMRTKTGTRNPALLPDTNQGRSLMAVRRAQLNCSSQTTSFSRTSVDPESVFGMDIEEVPQSVEPLLSRGVQEELYCQTDDQGLEINESASDEQAGF